MGKDYSKGLMYKITCRDTGESYVGSTIMTIEDRMAKHRSATKAYYNNKNLKKCTSHPIINNNNYYVEILEKYPCESKLFLQQRERYWIEKDKEEGNNLNKVIPTRSKPESNKAWHDAHKEEQKEKRAPYFAEYNSKESTKERKHNWYVENCEKSKEACIERRKERVECETCGLWYTKCRRSEHIKQQNHQWSVDNNMKYVKYDKDKLVNCECGATYKLGRKSDHFKTKKHKDYLAKE